jgi:hypothetical protein
MLDKFSEVFERYLHNSAERGLQTVTRLQANGGVGCDALQTVTSNFRVTLREELQANTGAGCNRVTVQKGENAHRAHIAGPGDEVVI